MRQKLYTPPILLLAALIAVASACGGAPAELAAGTSSVQEVSSDWTPRAGPAELAGLARSIEAGELSEGAVIQMLAFRERTYLPFRFRQGVPLDGRGWLASQELDDIRAGFVRLGVDGQRVLERCVREAADERVGGIHLAGDDTALMGRACLGMMADAYGSEAISALVTFAREPLASPTAILLQRATLELLPALAPTAELPGGSAQREWRLELAAWSAWLKQQGTANLEVASPVEACGDDCEEALMRAWIDGAAVHLVMPAVEAPEPRYVTTLREIVGRRAERWVPWLSDASKDALSRRDSVATLSTALLVDLWAVASAEAYPDYFRRIVLPTLVSAIRPSDVGAAYSRPLTPSEFVIDALRHSTGVGFPSPACEAASTETTVRSCLIDQARAWRSYQAAHSWSI